MSYHSNDSNPQRSPRKQTSTVDKPTVPSSSARFIYPLSIQTESSRFWDKQDHTTSSTSTLANHSKAKKAFLQVREQLALDLVREIDDKVMGGELSTSTTTTGGVKLMWSTRLRTAAGRAHWTKIKSHPLGDQAKDQHNLKIELSTKIITNERISSDIFG
jgi:hypothetical protein